MIQVKLVKTGEIKEVTKNVAHGMIERGEAKLLSSEYENRAMRSSHSKRYKTK